METREVNLNGSDNEKKFHQHASFATRAFRKYEVILNNEPCLVQVSSKTSSLVSDDDIIKTFLELDAAQKEKVFGMYYPGKFGKEKIQREEVIAVHKARSAAKKFMTNNAIHFQGITMNEDDITNAILVYRCNAFEGGLLFEKASRLNHSCDPNCIYTINDNNNTITVTAAADIAEGEELSVSYLGILLWGGYQVRRAKLQRDKYFSCECIRCCSSDDTSMLDLASGIPCMKCHPREQNNPVLQDELQWEEVPMAYCYPYLMTNRFKCSQCQFNGELGSPGLESILPKVLERVTNRITDQNNTNGDMSKAVSPEQMSINLEMDEQLFQLSLSILGPKHWTTNVMLLSLIDRSLSSFNAAMLLGESPDFEELAESCDSLERLWSFSKTLDLKVGSLPLLFKQTLGVARSLVALGDLKSKKYASQWINRADMKGYASAFESNGMLKVVETIESAWQQKAHNGLEFQLNNEDEMDLDDDIVNVRKKRTKISS